ncbi:MAG TPA: hypothetical protein PK147_01200 [Saprospiraceae bacterium]|nr:hypothetical protein [Saprospiraceae bacterium]MCB9328477.1 hypothetical protein [Lewinellaceae bacterium]HPK09596.1 hypothetical protein [Saprospiraceae bacterium]HPQ20433.1 hypothetical protein [Saprospiraceae bacterium]
MKKIIFTIATALILPILAFANHPEHSDMWYSPAMKSSLRITEQSDALILDFSSRNSRFDKQIFYRITRNTFRSKNGSIIKFLNNDKIKFKDSKIKKTVILYRADGNTRHKYERRYQDKDHRHNQYETDDHWKNGNYHNNSREEHYDDRNKMHIDNDSQWSHNKH